MAKWELKASFIRVQVKEFHISFTSCPVTPQGTEKHFLLGQDSLSSHKGVESEFSLAHEIFFLP